MDVSLIPYHRDSASERKSNCSPGMVSLSLEVASMIKRVGSASDEYQEREHASGFSELLTPSECAEYSVR